MCEELKNKYFDDCYFSIESGYQESKYVFIDGNALIFNDNSVLNIGETGFGTGLNLLVLEDYIEESKKQNINVTFTSVEKYPIEIHIVKKTLLGLKEISKKSLSRHISLYNNIFGRLINGWNVIELKREWGTLVINLYYGDILQSFDNYPKKNNVWFFDGHSPDKNPEMWDQNVFTNAVKYSEKGATFATFTAAGIVKRGLREAGFFVKRKVGFGPKRHMILGSLLILL